MQAESADQEQFQEAGSQSQSHNVSTVPTMHLHRPKPNKKHHVIYLTIIIGLIIFSVLIGFEKRDSLCEAQPEQQSQKAKLERQIEELKAKDYKNIVQINNMQNEINILTKKTTVIPQQPKQPQSQQSGPQKIQPKYPVKPQQPVKPVKPAQTIVKDKGKYEYLTPALEAISSERRQQGGTKKGVAGTVRAFEYFHKNSQSQQIQDILYDSASIQGRKAFHEERVKFLSQKKNMESFYLATFNNKLDTSRDEEQNRVQAQEYNRINGIWNFDQYQEELPMCVIVPGYNNNAKFRIEYNLNSIFQQNYTNYYAVIINDASTDGSDELYRKYFDFYNIDKSKYSYVQNPKRLTALENHYKAVHEHCSPDAIGINLDGDDQFIGKNVLKVFNAAYQKHKAGVIWSNFYWYDQGRTTMLGFTSEYNQNQKNGNTYRRAPQRFSHLRSFRCELFLKIDKNKYFIDEKGEFYRSAADMAMMFALLELSCGRNNKIAGYHYLYNINTGLNDYQIDRGKQAQVDQISRGKPALNCSQEFDEKMKNWHV